MAYTDTLFEKKALWADHHPPIDKYTGGFFPSPGFGMEDDSPPPYTGPRNYAMEKYLPPGIFRSDGGLTRGYNPLNSNVGSGSMAVRGAAMSALADYKDARALEEQAKAQEDMDAQEAQEPGSTYTDPRRGSMAGTLGLAGAAGLAGLGTLGIGALAIKRKLAARAAAAAESARAANLASTLSTTATHSGAPNAISRLIEGGKANWKPIAGLAAGGYLLNKMFNR